jgi:isopentenyl-diphosphate delta-isomerase
VKEQEKRAAWHFDDTVIAVDADDNEIGVLSRAAAHTVTDGEPGQLHRAFSVFLVTDARSARGAGHMVLCRRSGLKPLWPGFWTDSCSGHPRPGEGTVDAARRRVAEELRVEVDLIDIGHFIYRECFGEQGAENELCHVLVGHTGDFTPDPAEVSETLYVSPVWLAATADDPPSDFAPWLTAAIRSFDPKGMCDALA